MEFGRASIGLAATPKQPVVVRPRWFEPVLENFECSGMQSRAGIALIYWLCHDVLNIWLPRLAVTRMTPTHSHVNSDSLPKHGFFLLIWFLCIFSFGAHAGENHDPKQIYDRIKSLEAIVGTLQEDHFRERDPASVSWWSLICVTDKCLDSGRQSIELKGELYREAETDPVAAFFAGLLNLEYAQKFNNSEALTESVEVASKEARRWFAFASSSGIAAASWNMGVIYSTNLGVMGSKLAAIEWYGRAGHQYLLAGERESALAALEKMETMEAKHRDSIRLREALFPTTEE